MIFSISHHFHLLPREEKRRIQFQLGVILRNEKDPVRLRKTLQQLYGRTGSLRSLLQRKEGDAALLFYRLLDSFGFLPPEELSGEQADLLRTIPFALFPDDGSCVVPSEALHILMADPLLREDGYLLGHIHSLSPREKRSWLRWIDAPDRPDPDLDRGIFLYHRLSTFHRETEARQAQQGHIQRNRSSDSDDSDQSNALEEENSFEEAKTREARTLPEKTSERLMKIEGAYLETIFPDDPAKSPLAWFYRGVLPLYSVLGDMERSGRGIEEEFQMQILSELKRGRMVLKAETPSFGEKERYRIIRTRERPSPRPVQPGGFTGSDGSGSGSGSGSGNTTEGYLF